MTPQGYAEYLIDKVGDYSDYETMDDLYPKKQLALIIVDEIISTIQGEKIEWYLEVKRILETM